MEIIRIHERDNAAVALEPLKPGQTVELGSKRITVKEQIRQGHKVALCDLHPGEKVIKYGYPIGRADAPIETGQWVHSHNLRTGLKEAGSYHYKPAKKAEERKSEAGTFLGYPRSNGEAGIRNELWVIPTVGCVNGIGRKLAGLGSELAQGRIDGVYCFEHPYGCSQMGDDLEHTKTILLSLCQHPNAGGVLVLGLGCENLNLDGLSADLDPIQGKELRSLNCQDTVDEIKEGVRLIEELIEKMAGCQRQPQPLSKLKIGVKCGGSDGFSGITANPLVGEAAESLISAGASIFMTEVPEMFGAETILMERCKNRRVFEDLVQMIHDFKAYYLSHQQPVYENPSPGNKAGGITTLEEKSLGCIQKCGAAKVEAVWKYGQPIDENGLHLISAPGNDLVSATALAAAGAQMILFTTGRGTPLGAAVPTIKIATNTALADKKPQWIDFNAGMRLQGKGKDAIKEALLLMIAQVASGERLTCNEKNGIREFAIFKNGVTL